MAGDQAGQEQVHFESLDVDRGEEALPAVELLPQLSPIHLEGGIDGSYLTAILYSHRRKRGAPL